MWDIIWRWDTLWWILWLLYIPCCAGLIVIVLLQKGKGAGFAGAFGIGPGSDTVFGPRASQSLPVRLTYAMAAGFMILALIMSMLSGRVGRGSAPQKVEAGELLGTTESGLFDGIEDLGAATDEAQAAPETPAGSAEPAGADDAAAVPDGEAADTPAAEAPGLEATPQQTIVVEPSVAETDTEEVSPAPAPAEAPVAETGEEDSGEGEPEAEDAPVQPAGATP